MASNRNRRLQKEIADIANDPNSGIVLTSPSGSKDIEDFTRFKGTFTGPPDTPYDGKQDHLVPNRPLRMF